MKINIKKDHFEQAVTPDGLKNIIGEFGNRMFGLDDCEYLASSLTSANDFADHVDALFSAGAKNADVFNEIEQAASSMICAGFDLIRMIELWRGRHFLGDTATLIERYCVPKIGVMSVTEQRVTVVCRDAGASDVFIDANPRSVAQRLLRSL